MAVPPPVSEVAGYYRRGWAGVSTSRIAAPGVPGWRSERSELAHVGDQIGLLLRGQAQAEDEVEELNGVLQGQRAAVVQIRRALLDPAEREGLDGPVWWLAVEALHLQVVHPVVEEERGRMTGRRCFAETSTVGGLVLAV